MQYKVHVRLMNREGKEGGVGVVNFQYTRNSKFLCPLGITKTITSGTLVC